jgi:3alpha(or 20beta)-hydroxysteroid dehydrogenase
MTGKELADELGEAAIYVHLDVTSEEDWQAGVDLAERHFGRLDILVNNAGILAFGAIDAMTREEYDRLIQVNQVGTFLGMKYAIPALERAGQGPSSTCPAWKALEAARTCRPTRRPSSRSAA